MALGDSSQNPSEDDVIGGEGITLPVGIRVAADVHVTRYGSSSTSDGIEDHKVTIVTSLNAIFKEFSTTSSEIPPVNENEESHGTTNKKTDALESEEIFDQPVVRRSKKCTKLINVAECNQLVEKKVQINRIVILPYLGCTTNSESVRMPFKKRRLMNSSKSLENITRHSNKNENVRCNSQPPLIKRPMPITKNVLIKDSLFYSHGEYRFPKLSYTTPQHSVIPNLNHIKDSNSQEQFFEKSDMCNRPVIDSSSKVVKEVYSDKSILSEKINGFEQELFAQPVQLQTKATRNVSILHRPQTKNKATSTTSLNNKCDNEKILEDSIKGVLMPYISAGKDFPSELVLKLVPKKETIDDKAKEESCDGKLKTESTQSVETNLLKPITSISTKQKKKKGNIFTDCFKFKKKKTYEDDYKNNSDDSLNKEIYFPSIVEVYQHKKPRELSKEDDSDIDSANTSFYIEKKKNKTKLTQ